MEVKVKVLEDFRDRENDMKLRKAGTEFTVDQDRAKLLVNKKLVEIVKETNPKEKPAPKPKPAAANTKAKK